MTSRRSDASAAGRPRIAPRLPGARVTLAAIASAVAACGFDAPLLTAPRGTPLDASAAPDAESALDAGDGDANAPAGPSLSLIATGSAHTNALHGGGLVVWGKNGSGELGTGDTARRLAPVAVGRRNWSQVAAGDAFGCALEAGAGAVWCWGDDTRGQLATGDRAERLVPFNIALAGPASRIAVGGAFACAVLSDGSVWCWGEGRDGQLGPAGLEGGFATAPTRIGLDADWTAVSGGDGHVCGLRAGALYCWGRGASGQLGVGLPAPTRSDTPLRVGVGDDWVDLDAGDDATCAIRRNGALWCWGRNDAGQLGDPAASPIVYAPRPFGTDWTWTSIAVGASSVCGVVATADLYCWGNNPYGLLGLGDASSRDLPTRVPTSVPWARVDVGRVHACAMDRAGNVWCAGGGGDGALGLGDTRNHNVFTQVAWP